MKQVFQKDLYVGLKILNEQNLKKKNSFSLTYIFIYFITFRVTATK